MPSSDVHSAEVCLPSSDLAADVEFLEKSLGFRLDTIYPADHPAVATMCGHGLRVRLDRASTAAAPEVRLLCARSAACASSSPRTASASTWSKRSRGSKRHPRRTCSWCAGSRLAHIRIPDAGPVPDVVHYHTVGFQLIFCYSGWVRLVYEDQGPPFVLGARDCVIQPPEIRHRVLESSENLQVIEVGVPAGLLPPVATTHDADILFTFVLAGTVTLNAVDEGAHPLEEGDAYVVPPGLATTLDNPSSDLELLEVSLPAIAPGVPTPTGS